MRVTRIEELTKSRSKVYIDGEFAFVLYQGELRLYHMREDEDLEEKDYRAVMEQVLPKRARLRAMNLLKNREYTTAQLRDKLEQGLYPPQVIEEALAYVASFHYTDDVRYALQYITCHEENRSRRRIEQDLSAKGISRETLRAAWEKYESLGGKQDEEKMAHRLLEKRGFRPDTADYAERQKQAAFLMRKGFSGECIRRVLRQCEAEEDFFRQ